MSDTSMPRQAAFGEILVNQDLDIAERLAEQPKVIVVLEGLTLGGEEVAELETILGDLHALLVQRASEGVLAPHDGENLHVR
jgi:hypothetical protein